MIVLVIRIQTIPPYQTPVQCNNVAVHGDLGRHHLYMAHVNQSDLFRLLLHAL